MKVKTLTTYDVYNYGASLQAYALQRYIQSKGHEVEIINYQPEYLTRKYDYKWVNPESWMSKNFLLRILYRTLKFVQRQTTLGRKKKFDYFNHTILRETTQRYLSYRNLQNDPPVADLYIVGSDQIWNVFYEAGQDPAFYLDFVQNGKKISYAASFSYLDIDKEKKQRIQKSLQTFNAVSVREYHGLKILDEMNIKGEWVLDPVFLLETHNWDKLIIPEFTNDEFLLVYDFEKNDELKNFVLQYSKAHNLKIYSINDTYPLRYADKNYNSAGPIEFVTLIKNCKAFVSNSFHGTAFSIIFNKPFFVFNRKRHKVNSRMESLVTLFELQDCILSDEKQYTEAINRTFDYKKINSIIENETLKSKRFIDTWL